MDSLWNGAPADDLGAVTEQVLEFIAYLDLPVQKGVCAALALINLRSLRATGCRLSLLTPGSGKRSSTRGNGTPGSPVRRRLTGIATSCCTPPLAA